MNPYIYPPIHTEAHRRLKEDAMRNAHALRREAVNEMIDDALRGLRRWFGRQGDWLPLARVFGR